MGPGDRPGEGQAGRAHKSRKSVAMSADGKTIVFGSDDKTIHLNPASQFLYFFLTYVLTVSTYGIWKLLGFPREVQTSSAQSIRWHQPPWEGDSTCNFLASGNVESSHGVFLEVNAFVPSHTVFLLTVHTVPNTMILKYACRGYCVMRLPTRRLLRWLILLLFVG